MECTGHFRACTDYRMFNKCSIPSRVQKGVVSIDGLRISSETSKFLEFNKGCSETEGQITCTSQTKVTEQGGEITNVSRRELLISRVTGDLHYISYDGIPENNPAFMSPGEHKRGDTVEYAAQCSVRANKRLF